MGTAVKLVSSGDDRRLLLHTPPGQRDSTRTESKVRIFDDFQGTCARTVHAKSRQNRFSMSSWRRGRVRVKSRVAICDVSQFIRTIASAIAGLIALRLR